ncbi:MAG: hypothetical protein QCI00_10255, partial [Candidatus Thermoplasmatota archaeon]|nr:hypothetical protein [Candidatus Thermoplasmatota archaeon]
MSGELRAKDVGWRTGNSYSLTAFLLRTSVELHVSDVRQVAFENTPAIRIMEHENQSNTTSPFLQKPNTI